MDKKTAKAYKEVEDAIWAALKGKSRAVKEAVLAELGDRHSRRLSKINAWRRSQYEERKAAGVCIACGGSKDPESGVRCDPCRVEHNGRVNPDAKRRHKQARK